ncbi:MAG TPA: efflux RND transporter periplasmic adaptor subunit [Vicinamibacterales bacterium]|nr:efflux RND transporter periplasmic adaptor subunit [Vicinamibacterales bacterium]
MTQRRGVRMWLLALAGVAAACGSNTTSRETSNAPQIKETHKEEANAIHLTADLARDLRITTEPARERTGAQEVTVLGEVAPDQGRYAEVAPTTSGQIERVLVEVDAQVKAGTPLAHLRSTELGRARADLVSANAKRDLARQTFERKRSLAGERIVAQREVQEAEATFRAAEAEASAASTSLSALGVSGEPVSGDPSLFEVRTPVAGRVIERRAVVGQHADADSRLFVVADLSRVWIVAQAFERDAVNVRVGTLAHVTLAALPGQEFDGRVALVGRQVDAGSRTVAIRIELANAAGILRPGMSASARLEVAADGRTVVTVPAAALQRVGDRWLVFLPKGDYEYEMRPVGRGRDLGNEVEVVSGLRAGEMVVVEGAFLLKAEAEKRSGGTGGHD